MATSQLWVAGKVGYAVSDDGVGNLVEHPMAGWKFPAEAAFVQRNNFKSGGFQEGVAGFAKVRFTVNGPYALDASPIVLGGTYRWYLGIDATSLVEFFVDGLVVGMSPTNNAEGAPEIEFTMESVGPFSIASTGGVLGLI